MLDVDVAAICDGAMALMGGDDDDDDRNDAVHAKKCPSLFDPHFLAK